MTESRPRSYVGKLHDDTSRPHAAAVSVEVSPLVYFHELFTKLEEIEIIDGDDECANILNDIEQRMMKKHIRAGRLRKRTLMIREIDEEERAVGESHTRSIFSFASPSQGWLKST